MRRPASKFVLLLVLFQGLAPRSPAAEDGVEFFEKKVRPVLADACYSCHSATSKKLAGGLLLDSEAGRKKGGETGPAIVPGKPDESLLVTAVRYSDATLQMPPKRKLSAQAIADLESWVAMGAPSPRTESAAVRPRPAAWPEVLKARRNWWSLLPVREAAAPTVSDLGWSDRPIDRFILAGLEARGLAPAPAAPPRTLARRLALVLTGLPPDPAAVDAFVRGCEAASGDDGRLPPAVVERLVDGLLASPHFGEHWARHWMDVVRFSETHGNEWNYEVHHAWRYRDYLVRAFNADLPYDQFVREQIAGDLIDPPRRHPADRTNESVIGTAFYRFGEANHDDCIALRQIGYDLADNQIDTLTKAFQGTTVACARCHDHKLDAVSMDDYYALLGILRSSRLVGHTLDDPDSIRPAVDRLAAIKAEIRSEIASLWLREVASLAPLARAARARVANRGDAAALASGLDPKAIERWAAVLRAAKGTLDDPLEPWRVSATAQATAGESIAPQWRGLVASYENEARAREARRSRALPFLNNGKAPGDRGWQAEGLGLQGPASQPGDFAILPDGEAVLSRLLPAGRFTGTVSDKLNGALRSPALPRGKGFISFLVQGKHGAAVRLVSNNCQLNYRNYRALIADDLQWVTFPIPEDRESLRTYAELLTMLDNPKFPDQLATLGGDRENQRLPWARAVADPRSSFGVAEVLLHDDPEPPKPPLGDLLGFLKTDPPPATLEDLEARTQSACEGALHAWASGLATTADLRWINALLQQHLIVANVRSTPKLAALVASYREAEKAIAPAQVAPGVADSGPGADQPVFARGDCNRPGASVPRRYLEVLSSPARPFATAGSGRRELAERIADRDNPLTARVMVNRAWHHLFGAGLVRTVDDFGHVGDLPSHPELLDALAAGFVADGWSVKRLVRRIVLSRTFQASNVPSPAAREVDPQDRLLQHYPARRMDAEAIRDAILATSGRLDPALYGPSIQPFRDGENADRRLFPGPLDGDGRRSLYIKNNLMEAPKFLGAFNTPGGKVAQGRRDVTNVPAQALALLNDPFVIGQADAWAGRLVARPDATVGDRVDAMFREALGRPPSGPERERFAQAATRLAGLQGVPEAGILASRPVWKDLAHAVFNLQEMIYIP